MNRRELIKRAALASVAAGIQASVALAEDAVDAQENRSAGTPKRDEPEPSLSAGSGSLPAAFVLGPRAEVLDFCGPLEVFVGASTSDGKPLFAPYRVAATLDAVVVGGGMRVVPDYTFKTAPQPRVIVIPAMDQTAASLEMYEWIRASSKATDVTMSVVWARQREGMGLARPVGRRRQEHELAGSVRGNPVRAYRSHDHLEAARSLQGLDDHVGDPFTSLPRQTDAQAPDAQQPEERREGADGARHGEPKGRPCHDVSG